MDQIELKSNTFLASATAGQFDRELRVYSDWGSLWVAGEEFGASWVIQANSWEDAYEIWVDERPTVEEFDLFEAYGCKSDEEFQRKLVDGAELELAEGYRYQSNFSGTGIVFTGYYEWLEGLTRETMDRLEIKIKLEAY